MVELDPAVEHADAHAGSGRAAPGPFAGHLGGPVGRQPARVACGGREAPGGKLLLGLVGEHRHAAILKPRSSLPLVADVATDAQLVSRCRNGDPAAWNELVERFSRYVYAIAVQAFRLSPHDAEDVFQEVFARVYQHLDRLRIGRGDPAVDRAADAAALHRPAAGGRPGVAGGARTSSSRGAGTRRSQLDEALTVRAGLDAVGDPCRDILDRFFCRDESYKTIGEALDLPAGTIASRISRCLAKLHCDSREDLEGLGV